MVLNKQKKTWQTLVPVQDHNYLPVPVHDYDEQIYI